MSLTAQEWRYVGSANIGAATVHAALEALYSLGTAATYSDGSARTEGAGSAWTYTDRRYQSGGVTECLYPSPPSGSGSDQAVLFAGSASAKTPTMASPDAWATANILINIVRQPGVFNAWDNASPMTSGYTFGYWRAVACSAPTKVHLYESQECIWTVWETSGGDVYDAAAGALVDPETATTGAAESDGRLYGIMVSGQSAVRSQTTWVTGTPAAGNLFLHHTTAQSAHAGVLQPGTASIWTIQKTAAVTWDSNRLRNAASEYARLQIHMMRAGAAPNYFVGRLREMCFFVDGVIPTRHMSGVTTIGYILGSSSVTVSDSIFLKH